MPHEWVILAQIWANIRLFALILGDLAPYWVVFSHFGVKDATIRGDRGAYRESIVGRSRCKGIIL